MNGWLIFFGIYLLIFSAAAVKNAGNTMNGWLISLIYLGSYLLISLAAKKAANVLEESKNSGSNSRGTFRDSDLNNSYWSISDSFGGGSWGDSDGGGGGDSGGDSGCDSGSDGGCDSGGD